MTSENTHKNLSKRTRVRTIYFVLTVLAFSLFILKGKAVRNLFSSGTSGLVNTMDDSSRDDFLSSSNKLNELIKLTKDSEGKNNALSQSASHRAKIADEYVRMAEVLKNDVTDITLNRSMTMGMQAQEMIFGLEKASIKVKDKESHLLEIQPNSFGILRFGTSELINSMSIESRKKILSQSEEINTLIKKFNTSGSFGSPLNNSKDNQTDQELQEISRLYNNLATTLSDDLHNIQINNPRMSRIAKGIIESYQKVSQILLTGNTNFPRVHLEDVRY
jgi:hypothetical protein